MATHRGRAVTREKHAAAMRHRMELEFLERDLLHLAIRRMVFDPVLIPAKPIASVQNGRMTVRDPRQFG